MPIPRVLVLVAFVVLAPLGRADDVNHGSLAEVPDREFAVLAAQWGTGHRFADVTETARALATATGLDVAVERSHFGDPYPHFRKSLVVFYLWRGELYSATAPEHGRLRIPIPKVKAASARVEWIAGQFQSARAAAGWRLDQAVDACSIEAICAAVHKNLRLARRFAHRYGADLSGDTTGLAARIASWVKSTCRAAKGRRVWTVEVAASSDWRDLEAEAGPGDLVVFEAGGTWSLGRYAGSCKAPGLSGDRYRAHSTVGELPHGCLLVRYGTNLFAVGKSTAAWRVSTSASRLEAKCNDETYRDNTGSLRLRVLVLPATTSDGP